MESAWGQRWRHDGWIDSSVAFCASLDRFALLVIDCWRLIEFHGTPRWSSPRRDSTRRASAANDVIHAIVVTTINACVCKKSDSRIPSVLRFQSRYCIQLWKGKQIMNNACLWSLIVNGILSLYLLLFCFRRLVQQRQSPRSSTIRQAHCSRILRFKSLLWSTLNSLWTRFLLLLFNPTRKARQDRYLFSNNQSTF